MWNGATVQHLLLVADGLVVASVDDVESVVVVVVGWNDGRVDIDYHTRVDQRRPRPLRILGGC